MNRERFLQILRKLLEVHIEMTGYHAEGFCYLMNDLWNKNIVLYDEKEFVLDFIGNLYNDNDNDNDNDKNQNNYYSYWLNVDRSDAYYGKVNHTGRTNVYMDLIEWVKVNYKKNELIEI